MKQFFHSFLQRGLGAAALGPVVLAVVYLILSACDVVTEVSVQKISWEILTVTLMAFIAGGVSAIHTVERLSVFFAALIQGSALYVDYLLFYLLNGWLRRQFLSIVIFTVCFVLGYLVVWIIILFVTRARVKQLNRRIRDLSEDR